MSEGSRPHAFDADAVDSALRRELSRPHRESTPSASPHRKRQRINGDRFVPFPSSNRCQGTDICSHSALSLRALAKIFKRALACCMTTHPQPRPRSIRNAHPKGSCISRRVSRIHE